MLNFSRYDEAYAKCNQEKGLKKIPVSSWDFHNEFTNKLKISFLDSNDLYLMSSQNKWSNCSWDYNKHLQDEVIIVTNTSLNIVFASQNIIQMNGYSKAEVLGKSPKMFHGLDTDQKVSGEIREAIQLQVPFEKTILNYKKNGKSYLCHIKGFPVFNTKGTLSHFIAFEKVA
jgi:PAS domain S-box-containing protein